MSGKISVTSHPKSVDVKYLISLFINLAWILPSNAQSAYEIIQQHIEAIGGDQWDSVSTFYILATTNDEQGHITIAKTVVKDSSVRNDITIESVSASRSEKKYYLILDGDKGWKHLPRERNYAVNTLYKEEVAILWEELDYEDPFLRYLQKERTIDLMKIVYDEDKEYYMFSVTYKSGKQQYCYINTSTLMMDIVQTVGREGIVRYNDYKKTPEGLMIAREINSEAGTVHITDIRINPIVSRDIFKPNETLSVHN